MDVFILFDQSIQIHTNDHIPVFPTQDERPPLSQPLLSHL